MELKDAIYGRRAVRDYSHEPVDEDRFASEHQRTSHAGILSR
jgi:hypothetical protein